MQKWMQNKDLYLEGNAAVGAVLDLDRIFHTLLRFACPVHEENDGAAQEGRHATRW